MIPLSVSLRIVEEINISDSSDATINRMFKGGDANSDDGDSVQATMTMLYYDEG